MNSFKKMIGSKSIKRRDDGMFIQPGNLHIREGFNQRVDSPELQEENESLFRFIFNGGQVPPIEVVPRDEGGVYVVEGHRRALAFCRAIASGAPIEWIPITQFRGDNVDQTARIMNSNSQLKLTPYEQSMVVKKLAGFNLSPQEIADKVNVSRSKVDYLLQFANSPHQVKEMVKSGDVSLNVAVDQVKKHGEKATEKLSEQVEKAKESGKKVTKSVAEPQFSSKKARQLCELMSGAEFDIDTGAEFRNVTLPRDVVAAIEKILADYNEGFI